MSAKALPEVIHALSLTAELPEGTTVYKYKKAVFGNNQLARERRGTIGWFRIGESVHMSHFRHGKWFGSEAAVSMLLALQPDLRESLVTSEAPNGLVPVMAP